MTFQFSINRRSIEHQWSVDSCSIETRFMLNQKTTAHEINIYAVSLNIYSFVSEPELAFSSSPAELIAVFICALPEIKTYAFDCRKHRF